MVMVDSACEGGGVARLCGVEGRESKEVVWCLGGGLSVNCDCS